MSFFDSMNIVGSALTAERLRSGCIPAEYCQCQHHPHKTGEPYRRKQVVFQERAMGSRMC